MIDHWKKEAQLIGSYLVGKEIPTEIVDRYVDAMQKLSLPTDYSSKWIDKSIERPWKFAYYDSALAFRKPMPLLRRKTLMMLSLLETTTFYTNIFLPNKRKPLYLLKMIFITMKAIYHFCVGFILLQLK